MGWAAGTLEQLRWIPKSLALRKIWFQNYGIWPWFYSLLGEGDTWDVTSSTLQFQWIKQVVKNWNCTQHIKVGETCFSVTKMIVKYLALFLIFHKIKQKRKQTYCVSASLKTILNNSIFTINENKMSWIHQASFNATSAHSQWICSRLSIS